MTFFAKVEKNYGQEMTLKFHLPYYVDSAYAVVDGVEYYLNVEKEVAYLNTVISEEGNEIKIYLGGNNKYYNNCTHNYQVKEVVESTSNSFGYTLMECINDGCGNTYKTLFTDKVNVEDTHRTVNSTEAIVTKKEELE